MSCPLEASAFSGLVRPFPFNIQGSQVLRKNPHLCVALQNYVLPGVKLQWTGSSLPITISVLPGTGPGTQWEPSKQGH